MGYAQVEGLLRQLAEAAEVMVSNDERLAGLAQDLAGEIRQLEWDLDGAKDEALTELDHELIDRAVAGLSPLVLELQVQSIPPGFTGVGAPHSYAVLNPYREHIRRLQEVLRR